MKQILLIALIAVGLTANSTPPDINEKVLKAFKETFANATDVTWHENKNHYMVSFKQATITSRANYDLDGNLISTVRYYSEEHLPAHILAKVKKKFAGKSVFGVTELVTDDEISYHIKLEDEKNWYTVKSDIWGGLAVKEKYRKA